MTEKLKAQYEEAKKNSLKGSFVRMQEIQDKWANLKANKQDSKVGPTPDEGLTEDQIKLLENDNVVLNSNYTFKYLGISPVSLKLIIPDYLKRFKKY